VQYFQTLKIYRGKFLYLLFIGIELVKIRIDAFVILHKKILISFHNWAQICEICHNYCNYSQKNKGVFDENNDFLKNAGFLSQIMYNIR